MVLDTNVLVAAIRSQRGASFRLLEQVGTGLFDIVVSRIGLEWQINRYCDLRFGYTYEPSPVPPQRNTSNILDSDHHTFSTGAGFHLAELWQGSPQRFDIHIFFKVIAFPKNTVEKEIFIPENPGFPAIRSSGAVLATGLTLLLGY